MRMPLNAIEKVLDLNGLRRCFTQKINLYALNVGHNFGNQLLKAICFRFMTQLLAVRNTQTILNRSESEEASVANIVTSFVNRT